MTRERKTRGGFWPARDLPAVIWLVAVVAVALVHPLVPAPRWLMVHLLLLGAVTHSIMVWSRHFADALLHTAPRKNDRRLQSMRLLMLNGGVALVLTGVVAGVWPVTVVGATAVGSAVVWHGVSLVLQMKASLPSRFGATVRYYVAAASLLPVGALLGATLARGLGHQEHAEVMVAHTAVNVLGWMGLTVVGTLVTLWPTMLRTRIVEGAERAAQCALPVLVLSIVVIAGGALAGVLPLVTVGLVGYLVGLGVVARPFVLSAWNKPPASYPTWSVLAGVLWLVGCLATLCVGFATASSWDVAHDRLGWVAPALAVGFGAQVLFGALSYLIPMSLGGGPRPVRAANTVLDRGGALRIVMVNAGLLVCMLPVPVVVRVLSSVLVLVGLASFIPLLFLAIRASRKVKAAPVVAVPAGRRGAAPVAAVRPPGQVAGLAASGLAAVVLAVAVGVALDPAALAGSTHAESASAGAPATGATTHVTVEAANMRFTPSTIEVPAGNRLVIEVKNTEDADVHDLVLDSGGRTGRLSPGDGARIDVGVVGRDIEGWCSVVGHRQMGMELQIRVTSHDGPATASRDGAHQHSPPPEPGDDAEGAAAALDFMVEPEAGFVAHDAELPLLPDQRVHRRRFTVQEVEREVAPGVTQRLWTYKGTAPGPVLHGRVGDIFEITLVNDGSIGHSIDFHAGSLAPDGPMRTLAPGESLVYRFKATRAGIWMYHCSSMPMSAHIANGLFGAVVIDPPDLPEVDRSYVLIQSELFLGAQGGPVDIDKLQAEEPDTVVFNGYANQYDHRPLTATVGERVRIWVLDAGPNRATSFHVVGGQFDRVYSEGAYLLRRGARGSQTLALGPGQGGFVELTFPEPGHYPFVSHVMVDAERGAHGIFDVTE
ncbi:MAG: multicopper oxidase domain-containing protein [Nocardioides sp.]